MAAKRILDTGMQFNAGHGLNYLNVQPIAALPNLARAAHRPFHREPIGVPVGLREAVREMKRLIEMIMQVEHVCFSTPDAGVCVR